MKIVYNTFIPFRGFSVINLFGILFARKEYRGKINERILNHESIHSVQMKELVYVFFYLWYIIEWLVRLFLPGNAYRNISFEREAYQNERESGYIQRRKFWNFLNYMKGGYSD